MIPLFTLRGWRGQIGPGTRMGSSFGIGHNHDEQWVEVVSHEPLPDRFEDLRGWAPINTLWAACGEVDTDRREVPLEQLARLREGEGADVIEWGTRVLTVDGEPIEFEIHAPTEGVWCGIARLEHAYITIDSRGVLVEHVGLVTLSGLREEDWDHSSEAEPSG